MRPINQVKAEALRSPRSVAASLGLGSLQIKVTTCVGSHVGVACSCCLVGTWLVDWLLNRWRRGRCGGRLTTPSVSAAACHQLHFTNLAIRVGASIPGIDSAIVTCPVSVCHCTAAGVVVAILEHSAIIDTVSGAPFLAVGRLGLILAEIQVTDVLLHPFKIT